MKIAVALLAMALVVAVVGQWLDSRRSHRSPVSTGTTNSGPVTYIGGPVTYVGGLVATIGQGIPVEARTPYSYGDLHIENRGSAVAVLERASLVRRNGAMTFLGAFIPPDNRHHIGMVTGFRPSWGRPVNGFSLRPNAKAQVVIGLYAAKLGKHSFRAIRLAYRVGNTKYVRQFPIAIRFCAPKKKYFKRCRPPTPLAAQ